MSLGSGALPARGHHSAMLTVLVWKREWRVTQVAPDCPKIFTTSDLPKQRSKCPVGSHFRELTLSCRRGTERGGVRKHNMGEKNMTDGQIVVCISSLHTDIMSVDDEPERETALQAARSHRSQLWPEGSSHWGSLQQKACPHCARLHTEALEKIREIKLKSFFYEVTCMWGF